jgi:hypothetical protein
MVDLASCSAQRQKGRQEKTLEHIALVLDLILERVRL